MSASSGRILAQLNFPESETRVAFKSVITELARGRARTLQFAARRGKIGMGFGDLGAQGDLGSLDACVQNHRGQFYIWIATGSAKRERIGNDFPRIEDSSLMQENARQVGFRGNFISEAFLGLKFGEGLSERGFSRRKFPFLDGNGSQ